MCGYLVRKSTCVAEPPEQTARRRFDTEIMFLGGEEFSFPKNWEISMEAAHSMCGEDTPAPLQALRVPLAGVPSVVVVAVGAPHVVGDGAADDRSADRRNVAGDSVCVCVRDGTLCQTRLVEVHYVTL